MHYELILFFGIISFIYASVGFGGGSSYLALLALYALPFQEMKLTALVCNIVVVTGGTLLYWKRGELPVKKIIPMALVSVPMAFLGARLKISEHTFFVVLGVCLIVAGILLWVRTANVAEDGNVKQANYLRDGALGGAVGFLSGMVGIGGGIFLSPILNLMGWDSPRRIAATASAFILINSISGIAGQLSSLSVSIDFMRLGMLAIAVFAGGQLGSRAGALKFSELAVRRVTGCLVLAAGIEVLIKHWSAS